MRYVIVGAGAIGGTIGWALAEAGHEVVLVARGRHLDALRRDGLTVQQREDDTTVVLPAVGAPADIDFRADDVVVVATKSHDAGGALDALAAAAPPSVTVACATNGVDVERQALRRFERVLAVCTIVAATHLEPGVVQAFGEPRLGILDLGPYGEVPGVAETATAVAADLEGAGFRSEARVDVMRFKYRKLAGNVRNGLEALVGGAARDTDLRHRVQAEALAVFAASGIDVASQEEDAARRAGITWTSPRHRRAGGSTSQSLTRGLGTVETDYLNGEVVLLGRLAGLPTPVNSVLQRETARAARSRAPAGSMSLAELERLVELEVLGGRR